MFNAGHLAASRPFLWMRTSKSSSLVPPARQTTAHSAKPATSRAPAAAEVDAMLNSSHLTASRPFLWMRTGKSSSLVPPARQTTARGAIPSRAAVVLLAAGETPATADVSVVRINPTT